VRGGGILIIISMNVCSMTTVQYSIVKCFAQLTSTPYTNYVHQADRSRHGRTVGVGSGQGCLVRTCGRVVWGLINKISYDSLNDYLTIMPKLRSSYDGRLIYKTSHEGRKAFLGYDSLAEMYDRLR